MFFLSLASSQSENIKLGFEAGLLSDGLKGDASLPVVVDANMADLRNCPVVPRATCWDKNASGVVNHVTSDECGPGWHYDPNNNIR